MAGQDDTEFERRLREARESLDALRAGPRDADAGTDDRRRGDAPVQGMGEASDGKVRAVASRGRLQSLRLDPRVMRLPADQLGAHLAEAVNAAFSDLRSRSATAENEPVLDPAALADTLAEVQDQGLRQMTVISQTLDDVAARIASGTR